MSRREQIRMTEAEVRALLDDQRTLICATNGVNGWPHLMPLWFVVRGADIWAWTYAKSQKVRNLERDPRAGPQTGGTALRRRAHRVLGSPQTRRHPLDCRPCLHSRA
jgi:hypothetical protein